MLVLKQCYVLTNQLKEYKKTGGGASPRDNGDVSVTSGVGGVGGGEGGATCIHVRNTNFLGIHVGVARAAVVILFIHLHTQSVS